MGQTNLIGSREARERLNMARSTFQRAVQEGRVPFVAKLPGETSPYLFDASQIDELAKTPADAGTPRRGDAA